MGVVEGNRPATDNDWEEIKKKGDAAIKRWIDEQIDGKSCAIVLIGSQTAGRKWIKYEIEKSWNENKGVLGIYVHNLKDQSGNQALKGNNPFDDFTIGSDKTKLSTIVKAYNPPYTDSQVVYNHIKENLSGWIETAINIRSKY